MLRQTKLLTLIVKDFSEFFSSKSWIVVLILPLFITFLYSVIYRQAEAKIFTVGCKTTVSSPMRQIFRTPQLKLKNYSDLELAKRDLAAAKIDGVMLGNPDKSGSIKLLVDKTRSQEAAFIVGVINSALIQAYTNKNIPLLKLVYLNNTVPTRRVSLPIWLIQLILTICLLQAASAIADEKERQTIHSLLVSPMTLTDYMFSKLIWNSLIGTGSILLTLILTGASINYWAVLIYGLLGCITYSAISILIGLFSPSALFARTVGTLAYIISALPMMIKDLSFAWKGFLNLFPSYQIMYGLERALLPHPFNYLYTLYAIGLLGETLILLVVTSIALKKKADL
jgi:hypothetical protein